MEYLAPHIKILHLINDALFIHAPLWGVLCLPTGYKTSDMSEVPSEANLTWKNDPYAPEKENLNRSISSMTLYFYFCEREYYLH